MAFDKCKGAINTTNYKNKKDINIKIHKSRDML